MNTNKVLRNGCARFKQEAHAVCSSCCDTIDFLAFDSFSYIFEELSKEFYPLIATRYGSIYVLSDATQVRPNLYFCTSCWDKVVQVEITRLKANLQKEAFAAQARIYSR